MSISAAVSALFAKAKTDISDDIQHHSWNSIRTIMVIAFMAYLLYISHLVLTPDNLKLVAKLLAVFLVCNTATKMMSIWATVQVRKLSPDAPKPMIVVPPADPSA